LAPPAPKGRPWPNRQRRAVLGEREHNKARRRGHQQRQRERLAAQAIGKSRTFFKQGRAQGRIDPHTRQMIALVLRLHRSLSALVGDDTALMRHWLDTANRHSGGIPRQQLQNPEQLVELVQYLDAMRGRP
jgi:hypothetical protein